MLTDSLSRQDMLQPVELSMLNYLGTYPGRADDSRDAPTMA